MDCKTNSKFQWYRFLAWFVQRCYHGLSLHTLQSSVTIRATLYPIVDDDYDFLCPFNNIYVISRWWKNDNGRLSELKQRTAMRWIPTPTPGTGPGSSWSEVKGVIHWATRTLLYPTGVLTHLCLASCKWDIDKQCRPRSDTVERGVWSGSTLFGLSTGISVQRGILHHWGVQLILAYSWARPAILVVGKGRGGMFLFLLFLHFHSCSSFFPVPLFHLLYSLFYFFSPFLWETTQNDPQGLTCR